MNHFAVHLELTRHCKSTILQYKIKINKRKIMEKINESKSLFFEKINSQTDQKRTAVRKSVC